MFMGDVDLILVNSMSGHLSVPKQKRWALVTIDLEYCPGTHLESMVSPNDDKRIGGCVGPNDIDGSIQVVSDNGTDCKWSTVGTITMVLPAI